MCESLKRPSCLPLGRGARLPVRAVLSFFVLGVVFLGLGFNETGASGSCLPLCMEAPHRVCCFLYLFFMFSPIFSCVLGC
jgi:hypothetical protein